MSKKLITFQIDFLHFKGAQTVFFTNMTQSGVGGGIAITWTLRLGGLDVGLDALTLMFTLIKKNLEKERKISRE